MRTTLSVLLLASLLVGGCGRKKDWDDEIVLQLFHQKGVDLGNITITATQDGVSRDVLVKSDDVFKDCSSNEVRIILRSRSTVTIAIKPASGASTFTKEFSVPTSNPVRVPLAKGSPLEPECGTMPVLDGGGEIAKKSDGSACLGAGECLSGTCLLSISFSGTEKTLKNGYCTRSCAALDGGASTCSSGQTCVQSTDGKGSLLGSYCFKNCTTSAECRESDDFTCSVNNVCSPK
jgi:hypothetical protein